jgi:hypothetical protein
MKKPNGNAEKIKRQLLIGRISAEFGEVKIAAILRELHPANELIDAQFNQETEPLKICVGCGRTNLEGPVKLPALACCPDNKYITVREYWENSLIVPKK